jgi:hypothetical protein
MCLRKLDRAMMHLTLHYSIIHCMEHVNNRDVPCHKQQVMMFNDMCLVCIVIE